MDEELMAMIVSVAVAIGGLMLQKLKAKDSDKHGDAFIEMLKDNMDTVERVGEIFPALKPAVDEYVEIVNEAEQIWESSGFTAQDIQFIALKAKLYKDALDRELDKLRKLRE